jgi:nucleoside-diphosphate-sugar epimerase
MKRAIITGATGAIGTALIKELITRNIEVMVICRRDSRRLSRIPEHPLITRKYCSLSELSELQNDTGKTFDAFFHFAWAGTFGPDRNDMHMQNDNVKYALDAVEAAKRFGCEVFLGAGSQAEYGRVEGEKPLRASTPAFPENGYGMAKLCAGEMTRVRAEQLGIRHIWMRILSVYGPYDGDNSLVSCIIRDLKNNVPPRCTKGEQEWDYLYSGDAARAFIAAAERGIGGKIYPLGGGTHRPLSTYISDIRDVVNPESDIDFGAIPYNDKQVMYLCADTSELEHDTGWSPEMNFQNGIKEILATH